MNADKKTAKSPRAQRKEGQEMSLKLPKGMSPLTLGQVTDRIRDRGIEVEKHQVAYAIDRYRIKPVGRAGILRVWSENELDVIEWAVRRCQSNSVLGKLSREPDIGV